MKRENSTRIADRTGHIGFRCPEPLKKRIAGLCEELGKDLTDAMLDYLPDVEHKLAQEVRRRQQLRQTTLA